MPRYTLTLITVAGLGALTHALYVRHAGRPAPAVPAWLATLTHAATLLQSDPVPGPASPPGPAPQAAARAADAARAAAEDEPAPATKPAARTNSGPRKRSSRKTAPSEAGRTPRISPPPAPGHAPEGTALQATPATADGLPSLFAPVTSKPAPGTKSLVAAPEQPAAERGPQERSAPGLDSGAPVLPPAKAPVRSIIDSPARGSALAGSVRTMRFAAGLGEAYVPLAWQAAEVPLGRLTRLLITPAPPPENARDVVEGVWLTYHARPAEPGDGFARAIQLCEQALRRTGGDAITVKPCPPLAIDTWPTARVDFHLPAARGQPAGLRGFRALIQTTQGMCEVHAMAPDTSYPQLAPFFEQILMTLRFPTPAADRVAVQPPAGRDVTGVWQGPDQRVRVGDDGQIAFETALPWHTASAPGGLADPRNRTTRSGRYEVRGDVLTVRWEDGTRTNYRWQVWNGRLLLTEESGRIAMLDRASSPGPSP